MDQLLEEWGEHLRAIRGRAPSTVAKYLAVSRRALSAMGVEAPAGIQYELVEAHLRGLYVAGRAESTRAGVVTALRELCSWLALRGEIEGNPLARMPRPKVYRREMPVLRPAEVELLIWGGSRRTLPRDPAEARNRALWGVMYMAGLRASEPGRLRLEDLRWDEEAAVFSLLIRGAKWQDEDVRRDTDEDVGRLLGAYLQQARPELLGGRDVPWVFPGVHGGPLTRDGVAWLFARRVEAVGLEGKGRRLSPHILRHSICTHMLEAGSNIRLVQQWMRHESLETTQLYAHADTGKIQREWRKRHPLKTAARKAKVPSMHRALGGLLQELRESGGG